MYVNLNNCKGINTVFNKLCSNFRMDPLPEITVKTQCNKTRIKKKKKKKTQFAFTKSLKVSQKRMYH